MAQLTTESFLWYILRYFPLVAVGVNSVNYDHHLLYRVYIHSRLLLFHYDHCSSALPTRILTEVYLM